MYAPDTARVATPIGIVSIEGDATRVTRIGIAADESPLAGSAAAVCEAAAQIEAYLAGRLRTFDLPLALMATPRGEALRAAILGVGFDETASYGALARRVESSARALGQACARNPFPIVVPCHRVLQEGESLGPYSAGEGPVTKRRLLAFEGATLL